MSADARRSSRACGQTARPETVTEKSFMESVTGIIKEVCTEVYRPMLTQTVSKACRGGDWDQLIVQVQIHDLSNNPTHLDTIWSCLVSFCISVSSYSFLKILRVWMLTCATGQFLLFLSYVNVMINQTGMLCLSACIL